MRRRRTRLVQPDIRWGRQRRRFQSNRPAIHYARLSRWPIHKHNLMQTTPPNNLKPDTFLRNHWQKKHHLFRQAFPEFTPPVNPDELAGLACEEDVESRIVIQRPGDTPEWVVRSGPFTAADFAQLPDTHWTLLVQDVDKHVPDCAELLDHFRFLPDWRIDDLMVSYAAPQGSVGPHTDAYDVFLLQGLGTRQWQLQSAPQTTSTIPNIELKLLNNFDPEEDHTLTTGDMLYLPPGVGHHGIAQNECMTLSIGFRAPNHAEMLADFAGWLAAKANPQARYGDPDLAIADVVPGQIDPFARERIRTLVRRYLDADDAELDRWFGCFITEPKPWLVTLPPETPLTPDQLRAKTKAGCALRRSPYTRMHFIPSAHGAILFCDGTAIDLAASAAPLAPLLAQQRRLTLHQLENTAKTIDYLNLITELYNAGKYDVEHD